MMSDTFYVSRNFNHQNYLAILWQTGKRGIAADCKTALIIRPLQSALSFNQRL
jgi:hypothetical protein